MNITCQHADDFILKNYYAVQIWKIENMKKICAIKLIQCYGKAVAKLFIIAITAGAIATQSGCTNNASTAGATGTFINHDRRTAGAIVDDQAISIKANLAISKDKDVWRKCHINTLSYNGVLLLVGQAPDEVTKSRVEELLHGIPEITKVYNQITVGTMVNFSSRMQDTWITTQVKTKILSSREIGPNRVKVVTEDGKVYLMGLLTKDEEEVVSELVRKIKGVEEVVTVFEESV